MNTTLQRFYLKYSIKNYDKKRILTLEPIGEGWDIDIDDEVVVEMSFPKVEQSTYGFAFCVGDNGITLWHESGRIEGVYVNKKKINAYVDLHFDFHLTDPLQ